MLDVVQIYRYGIVQRQYYSHTYRGVGTGPADPATAGPKFSVHQERPQLINIIH